MGVDAISCCAETIVDLPGFVVLAAAEYGGELELLIETTIKVVHCEHCGGRARAHDRKGHLLRDVPVSGRATVLVWWKRIWRCPDPLCAARTWTERSPMVAPRRVLTERARAWVTGRVGRDGETVAAVARSLSVGWWSVMRAVVDVGSRLLEADRWRDSVTGLGVDEHAVRHEALLFRMEVRPPSAPVPFPYQPLPAKTPTTASSVGVLTETWVAD